EIFDAISSRRSIRKFKPDPVPENDLRTIIECATKAPNANNRQMWKFVAITNREILCGMKDAILKKLDALSQLPETEDYRARLQASRGYSTFFADAPVTIAVFREPYESAVDELLHKRGIGREMIDQLRQRPDIQSIGAAVENLVLAAHALGYGTCWMSSPCLAGQEIANLLNVKSPWELVALLPLGEPDQQPAPRPRKPLEEVLEFIR
ncbi:MAG TPA: nitroreductase family protein, partial [Armatimonadota bacterium]